MSYQKPEVVALASALQAIQGNCKSGSSVSDAYTSERVATPSAYESDE